MKKNYWIIIFLLLLAADITGIQLPNEMLEKISKPLLMPVLAVYFLLQTKNIKSNFKSWILAALFFSWAGDVLLMFQADDSNFFLFGLSAFLLAHVFYIILFYQVKAKEGIKIDFKFLLIVVTYYAALIFLLFNHLGTMQIPVIVYGLVISSMFMLAMHMLFIKNKAAGKAMMIGALLFILSDSLLAINKFYQPFELAGVIVILTYGLAQLLIIKGTSRYIKSVIPN
ncbi:MAG TPA: lysoplasmalogenase [Chitinophagaceae bacterium]|nr:lysoplasmalogenase [Chitinophagaceae bacterium]